MPSTSGSSARFVSLDWEWCAQVTRFTISKISLGGGDDDDQGFDHEDN